MLELQVKGAQELELPNLAEQQDMLAIAKREREQERIANVPVRRAFLRASNGLNTAQRQLAKAKERLQAIEDEEKRLAERRQEEQAIIANKELKVTELETQLAGLASSSGASPSVGSDEKVQRCRDDVATLLAALREQLSPADIGKLQGIINKTEASVQDIVIAEDDVDFDDAFVEGADGAGAPLGEASGLLQQESPVTNPADGTGTKRTCTEFAGFIADSPAASLNLTPEQRGALDVHAISREFLKRQRR